MWELIQKYFQHDKHFLTRHHLDSFHYFLEQDIRNTIKNMNPFSITKLDSKGNQAYKILIWIGGTDSSDIEVTEPPITADHARMNDMTYTGELMVKIHVEYYEGHQATPSHQFITADRRISICSIPIMLKSKLHNEHTQERECAFDHGGYFIIDGKEKVIVAEESTVVNKLFVKKHPSDSNMGISHDAFIRAVSEKDAVFPKTTWFYVLDTTQTPQKIARHNAIVVAVRHIEITNQKARPLPLFQLFRMLGVTSDKRIIRDYIKVDPHDEEMLNFLLPSARDCVLYSQDLCLHDAKDNTKYQDVANVKKVLLDDLFPHTARTFEDKARFLGQCVNQIVKVCLGRQPDSNRDNFMFKRVDASGHLLSKVFSDLYNTFRVEVTSDVTRMYEDIARQHMPSFEEVKTLVTESNVTSIFTYTKQFRFGLIKTLKSKWGVQADDDQGKVQDLSRISFISFVSHLRRVNNPLASPDKIREPHQLNGSQFGVMCPCESPDGARIGLLKNMAMFCYISNQFPSDHLRERLRNASALLFKEGARQFKHQQQIYINRIPFGFVPHDVGHSVCEYVRLLRRCGFIDRCVSVTWDVVDGSIDIFCDRGRCCRPLIHDLAKAKDWVSSGKSWLQCLYGLWCDQPDKENSRVQQDPFHVYMASSLQELLQKLKQDAGCVEYLDVEEVNVSMVAFQEDVRSLSSSGALRPAVTHHELHPTAMFSAYTCTIPFCEHNQGPRNMFSGAQGKQALGVYSTSFPHRIDTASYVLHYPQKPLVATRYHAPLHMDELPNGENVIVAIACYSGYNQEDSIIFNKSSVERGMFNVSCFSSHILREEENVTICDPSRVPDINMAGLKESDDLKPNGLPHLNTHVKHGTALVGKVITSQEYDDNNRLVTRRYGRVDRADRTVEGFVDKAVLVKNHSGTRTAKLRIRKWRVPEPGDKCASRHGQKGVVGAILPHHEMPFNKDGLVPDIIINPHAFPTRMTIGHLIEAVLCKYCCAYETRYDGTAFEGTAASLDQVSNLLQKRYNFDYYGDEVMYNGISGEQMSMRVCLAPTYYYRLKHMVADKINARSTGKVMSMTKQPNKGRSNAGGLRIGEMETNAILAHGTASFLKESLLNRSDLFVWKEQNCVVPYAFKQLDLELGAASIKMHYNSAKF